MSSNDAGPPSADPSHEDRPEAVQGVPFTQIAERFGTPVCVYDADELHQRWEQWRAAHPEPLESAYLLSANPNVAISAMVRTWCAGALVGTHTELTSALLSGYPADAIVLDGPLGSTDLVEAALRAGIGAFAVAEIAQAALLDDAAARAGLRATVVARVDPKDREATGDFVSALQAHPLEHLRLTGVCLPRGPVTHDLVQLTTSILDRLTDLPAQECLVVLQPQGSLDATQAGRLTGRARVVVAGGGPQLHPASTVLSRVVRTTSAGPASAGPESVGFDCPLPEGSQPYPVPSDDDRVGAADWSTVRIGDLVATRGVSLLDLPLPMSQIVSHGVPAEVLVVDGRAVSIRSAATTEYLLSRQSSFPHHT